MGHKANILDHQSRSLMNLCKRLQRLPRSEGIRLFLFQAFHKPAQGSQEQNGGLLQEVRHGRPSTLPATSRHRTIDKTLSYGHEVRQDHPSMLPGKAGPGTMARSLVKTVMGLSDVKEEVYGALDEWAAFELEFPIVATRKALERLRQLEQWHRIIQVTKWMLSKGIGRTHNTYGLMLKAYCMDGRLEEAEELWDKLLTGLNRSMPKNMFAFMTNAYRKQEMPEKVVEVFEQMESFGIKPDKDLLRRAEEAYQQLNMEEKLKLLGNKYALDSKTRRKEKRLMAKKALKASKREQSGTQTDRNLNTEYPTDDEDNFQEQATTAQGKQTGESSSIDGTSNHSKNSKKSDTALSADDEFVKQIIATM